MGAESREMGEGMPIYILDLGEAGAGAGVVLITAGRAADADGGDRVIADLDRQAALRRYELGVENDGD